MAVVAGTQVAAGVRPEILSHGEASISPPAWTLPLCQSTWLGSPIAEKSVPGERRRYRRLDRRQAVLDHGSAASLQTRYILRLARCACALVPVSL